jgi:Leucine-rich repeat (LRR) protein
VNSSSESLSERGLERLSVRKTQITDAGVEHLKGLTNLAGLDLSDTQITDAGLTDVKGMTSLTS